jgi:hypothetical protein
MTLENARARYNLYISQGRLKEAQDIADNRPEVISTVEEEKKEKTVKSKKTKA